MRLSSMINIGPRLEELLKDVGINDSDELREVGSVEATVLLYKKNYDCRNKLYAIEGAIREMRWHNLSKEEKKRLDQLFEERIQDLVKA